MSRWTCLLDARKIFFHALYRYIANNTKTTEGEAGRLNILGCTVKRHMEHAMKGDNSVNLLITGLHLIYSPAAKTSIANKACDIVTGIRSRRFSDSESTINST